MASDELDDEESFRSLFMAAYLADCLECISKDMKLKLAHVTEQKGMTASWQALVEADFGIDRDWVRRVFKLLTEKRPPSMSLLFIMRGFECVDPKEQLAMTFGDTKTLQERTSKFQ